MLYFAVKSVPGRQINISEDRFRRVSIRAALGSSQRHSVVAQIFDVSRTLRLWWRNRIKAYSAAPFLLLFQLCLVISSH